MVIDELLPRRAGSLCRALAGHRAMYLSDGVVLNSIQDFSQFVISAGLAHRDELGVASNELVGSTDRLHAMRNDCPSYHSGHPAILNCLLDGRTCPST